jgi:hypothetical protein
LWHIATLPWEYWLSWCRTTAITEANKHRGRGLVVGTLATWFLFSILLTFPCVMLWCLAICSMSHPIAPRSVD